MKNDNLETWYYEFNPFSAVSENGQFTVKAGEVGTPICMLPMPYGGINTREKQESNAKKLAAVPEMIDCLKDVIEAFPPTSEMTEKQIDVFQYAESIIQRLEP